MTDRERQEKEKKKKRRESDFERMMFQIMEKSLKEAMKAALDDVFKDWKL